MENYWFHNTSEICENVTVGNGTKIWHNSQVLSGANIGKNCVIGHNCVVYGKAVLGDGVKIQSNTDVWDLVTLEDFVFVGPSVVFTNDKNPRAKYPKKGSSEYGEWIPTLVKSEASIGANATILCGTVIGKCALVGAGTLVVKDVPDYALVVGVPGKVVGWVCECGNKIQFDNDLGECTVCSKKYKKDGDVVTKVS